MKRTVDLDRAAEGELFGAPAIGPRKHRGAADSGGLLTTAQKRAAASLASSLVELAREAGAGGRAVLLGDLLLELRQDGAEEVLSIRKALAHYIGPGEIISRRPVVYGHNSSGVEMNPRQ